MHRSTLNSAQAYGHIVHDFPEAGDSDPATEKDGGWLISFVDILTLLVTLFVLLLAFSQVPDEITTITPLMEPVRDQTHPEQQITTLPGTVHWRLPVPEGMSDKLEITTTDTAVNLVIKDDLLFDAASASVNPAGRALLDRIADLLSRNSFPIAVEGHTDNAPIHTARYPSNWELSAARAADVTRFLIEHGIARERLRATGYADTRPVADNATREGRASNRRVSLVVHVSEPVTGTLGGLRGQDNPSPGSRETSPPAISR